MDKVKEFLCLDEWKNFENYYMDNGFIEQIGLFRYEDAHSNFLASLLKKDNVYGYEDEPMRLFLKLIKNKNEKYLDGIDLSKSYKIKYLNIKTRKKLKKGTPDLYITFSLEQKNFLKDYLIILEAKLNSNEGKDQTDRYYESVKDYKNLEKIFLFLTLDRGKCKNESYILINYQDLIDYIYEKLPYNETISNYLKSFNSVYEDYDKLKYLAYITISPDGKKLTKNLWNKVKKIDNFWSEDGLWKDLYKERPYIFKIFILNVLKSNEVINMKVELQNTIKSYYERMKYIIVIDGIEIKPNSSKLIYSIIEDLIKKENIRKISDIDNRLLNTTGTWKNLISKESFNKLPRKSKRNKKPYKNGYNETNPLKLDNIDYYVITSSLNDSENFLITLKECYPKYYKEHISIKPYIENKG